MKNMTLKEKVLFLLEEEKGKAISGQEIAQRLSVTRAAVWKAVRALQNEGYEIEAVTNRGYELKQSPDVLSAASIRKELPEKYREIGIVTEKTVDSTNSLLKEKAAAGEIRDIVLLAEEQKKGRGRRGSSFFSPQSTGLYMSLLLHTDKAPREGELITAAAAAATARGIENISGKQTRIKWGNDICVEGKKAAGILTEASVLLEEQRMEYIIVGIGIYLLPPGDGFSGDSAQEMTSVFKDRAEMGEGVRNRLAAEIIRIFLEYYENLSGKAFLEEYRSRSCEIGRKIFIEKDGAGRQAEVLTIDDNGHLLVKYEDGQEEALSGGKLKIRLLKQ